MGFMAVSAAWAASWPGRRLRTPSSGLAQALGAAPRNPSEPGGGAGILHETPASAANITRGARP